ncbi:predicted protein [Streptomyces viridosporus ATCC 14672]|uniref:Predicted protein n=1 Tax=Streptomyces viridosporus (strain ATCC 14672 / DSM 40746 / JCM 4963 / KCTC 9882 / NRRL B-12104 / FH 1290) TaxID=566461 RepID=D5ZX50_STRV1|nr:predicted protein [Streptomyces viridosporus ATCC 14672]
MDAGTEGVGLRAGDVGPGVGAGGVGAGDVGAGADGFGCAFGVRAVAVRRGGTEGSAAADRVGADVGVAFGGRTADVVTGVGRGAGCWGVVWRGAGCWGVVGRGAGCWGSVGRGAGCWGVV